ncbi:MAG: cytochrome c biogenesis protein CcsA [Elusimicrobiota bacterium]
MNPLKKHLPSAVVALAALGTISSLMPPRSGPGFDAQAFGALPVLHDGRVKPLDSLARSALLMLRGKQTATAEDGRRLTASQWLLETLAHAEAADKAKVFMINDPDVLAVIGHKAEEGRFYAFSELSGALDELRAQAEQARRLEASARSRFQAAAVSLEDRLTLYQRLKNSLQVEDTVDLPRELAAFSAALLPGVRAIQAHTRGGAKGFDMKALQALTAFFERYRFLASAAAFHALPPLSGESPDEWLTMGDGLLGSIKANSHHPAIADYALLTMAYRAGDVKNFNSTLADYRIWIDAHLPKTAAQARWEVVFNRAEPFYQGILLYAGVLLLCFASWLLWEEPLRRAALALLQYAFVVHSLGLAWRVILQGRPPVTNLYSSAIFIGWFAVLLSLVVERMSRRGFGTLVAGAVGSTTLIIAHNLTGSGDTMEMMRAVLDSNFWLATHVVTVTIGYSSTFLAAALAHVYILRGLLTPTLDKDSARDLVKMTYGVICFSLFFSFVGTVLGGIWADQSWGRFWGWDPKENGALLIVLWNAIILHARWGGYARDRGVMVMAVFGGIITSLSWFGVNMLGIGLHSYGFMDKAFYALAAFSAVELAVMAAGALPGRFWRSRAVIAGPVL